MGLFNRLSRKAEQSVDWLAELRAAWSKTTPVANEDDLIHYWNSVPLLERETALNLSEPNTDYRVKISPLEPEMDDAENAFVGVTGSLFALIFDAGAVFGRDIARKAITFHTQSRLRFWAETYDATMALCVRNYIKDASNHDWPVIVGGQLSIKPYEMHEFIFQYIRMEGYRDSFEECILSTERRPKNSKIPKK